MTARYIKRAFRKIRSIERSNGCFNFADMNFETHVSQNNQKTQLAVRENILQTRILCVRISNFQETEIARSSSNSPKTTSALIIDDRWKLVRFRVHTRMKARAASSGNFWILRPARKKKVQWNSSVFSRVSLLPWFKEKWQNSGGNSRDRCNNGFLYFLSLHHATLFLSSYSDNRELYSLYPIYFDLYFRNRAICENDVNLPNDRTLFFLSQNARVNGPMVCHDAVDTNVEL